MALDARNEGWPADVQAEATGISCPKSRASSKCLVDSPVLKMHTRALVPY